MPKIVVLRNNGSNNDVSCQALANCLSIWCDDIVAEPSAMRNTARPDFSRQYECTHPR